MGRVIEDLCFDAHLQAGHASPGLFIVRRAARLADVLDFIAEVARDDDEDEWRDVVTYIP
jgi:hypothetical protein